MSDPGPSCEQLVSGSGRHPESRSSVRRVTGDIIVALVVVAALGFDFTNGFHDTANAMATTIATGALPPRWR